VGTWGERLHFDCCIFLIGPGESRERQIFILYSAGVTGFGWSLHFFIDVLDFLIGPGESGERQISASRLKNWDLGNG